MLYRCTYMIFRKGQNYGDSAKIRGLGLDGWKNRWSTGDFPDSKTILSGTLMVDTYHYTFVKPIKCTPERMNATVNDGLQLIMVCQYSSPVITNVPL